MEKMILSLKNIYKMLMNYDFPIYSESVISEKERKGQTLLRFWQREIIEEFKCMPYGKMIWRNDGKRNRYTSHLCNRSRELKCYQEYAYELTAQVSETSIINQITRFMTFLSEKEYKHDVLLRRVKELMQLCVADDACVTEEIAAHINANLVLPVSMKRRGMKGNLFQAGYLLTLLTLYALTGEAMCTSALVVLQSEDFEMELLWQKITYTKKNQKDEIKFLTSHVGILQDNPLPPHRFFGREEELYDLQEMAASGQKCMILGMGGIGKTELLRQLIQRCAHGDIADKIGVISYEAGIAKSFMHCFGRERDQNPEDSYRHILHRLAKEAEGSRVLLLIDNLTESAEQDKDLEQLLALPCSILITSRYVKLDGFINYFILQPSVSTGALIFRDNYGHPLSVQDQLLLKEWLKDEAICHPMTLRLMARAARSKKWSVMELWGQLDRNGISLSWQEEDGNIQLDRMYHQLYSYLSIPNECQEIAQIFTLLPRDSYSLNFLKTWFGEFIGDHSTSQTLLINNLSVLTDGGWLEGDLEGWSMHPLIAQCLRHKIITEERIAPMLRCIQQRLQQIDGINPSLKEDKAIQRISHIVIHMASFLSGRISKDLILCILTAMGLWIQNRQSSERNLRLMERLIRHCRDMDDQVMARYYALLGYRRSVQPSKLLDFYYKQKNMLTIPKADFLNFCLHSGSSLNFLHEYQNAQMMIREVLCEEAQPFQKASAYFNLTRSCELSGDAENAFIWAKLGAEYAEKKPDCGVYITFRLWAYLCQIYIKYGRQKDAEGVLERLKDVYHQLNSDEDKCQYEFVIGLYEMKYGDLDQALQHTKAAMYIAEEYEGRNTHYFRHLGQIAGILRAMGRYEEALKHYKTLLVYVHENNDAMLIHLYNTNISTVYLALNKPQEALEHLEIAMDLARKQRGIALGEVQRNRAKAYELLGNYDAEYICLKEAVPLLENAYGCDHMKVVEAGHRLTELENICK